jgi:hypothetical protein
MQGSLRFILLSILALSCALCEPTQQADTLGKENRHAGDKPCDRQPNRAPVQQPG